MFPVFTLLQCQLGGESLHIQGGTASPMKYGLQDYGTIQLFLDLMTAGWKIPRWLKRKIGRTCSW